MNQPIFITGADRSGTTLIARIIQICGVFSGVTSNMLENLELREMCKDYLLQNKKNGEFMPATMDLQIPIGINA